MALVQWTPFRDLERMFEDDDFFFPVARRGAFAPSVDLYEEGDTIVAEAALPGMKKEDFNVVVENDVLTIKGQSQQQTEAKERGYYRKEVRSGSFSRAMTLPVAVQADQVKAVYKDGILKISMPKAEHAKAKTIQVEVEENQ